MKLRIGQPLALAAFVCCCLAGAQAFAQKAYITNFYSNTVSVIDTATNTVTATISDASFNNPAGVAVSPDGSKVYVTNEGSSSFSTGTVSVIDAATDAVTPITVGGIPFGAAVSPDGSKVYAAITTSVSGAGAVSVIDTATNHVTATITNSSFNNLAGLAVSPDGSKVYVANSQSNSVSVIDVATNTVVAAVPVGTAPIAFGVFIQPEKPPPKFAGTPGKANCFGVSVTALVPQYGGLNGAAAALGYPSVRALQQAIMEFCERLTREDATR